MKDIVIVFSILMTTLLQKSQAWIPACRTTQLYQKHVELRKSPTQIYMIGNIFGGKDTAKLPSLPRDVKEAVSRCREATQAALGDRVSRMDIDFPVGTKFGVEKTGKKAKRTSAVGNDNNPTKADLDRSDRELARIFVEMFQPVGNENLVVAFNDFILADAAKAVWKGDPSAGCRILSMDRKKGASEAKKKKAKAKGFAAKLAAEVGDSDGESGPFRLPDGTEVALFVAPGPKEMVIIERLSKSVGMGTLIVLLNARKTSISNFGSEDAKKLFLDEFESVFSLGAADQQYAPGCLLYRAYSGKNKEAPWVLARKPAVGPPKTILAQVKRPTGEECRTAFESLELSDVEKNVENAMENVAGWFR